MTKLSAECSLDNVWVRVNTNTLSENAAAVLSYVRSPEDAAPELMAVVKADGYGHGCANAALAFRTGGATWFGVTTLTEALELTDAGINSADTPILVFAPLVTAQQCEIAIERAIHATVCDAGHVELISRSAADLGIPAHVHLKVDTGMGRLGLLPEEAVAAARLINANRSLKLAAVYTHFAGAGDSSLAKTKKQLNMFVTFCDNLRDEIGTPFLRHCANSSALLRLPEARMDIVRAGTVLYGQYPSAETPKVPGLNADTFALEARTVFVHDLPAGAAIGYGSEFITRRATRAAVLPVGFFDGIGMQPASISQGTRGIKNLLMSIIRPRKLTVKFGQFNAPVLGRVAMQMIVVDVTDAPSPIVQGDIATVPVRRLAANSRLPRILSNPEALM